MDATVTRKILHYMSEKGYTLARSKGQLNLVAIEGMNPNGTLNSDEPDKFNDVIGLLDLSGASPQWVGTWVCTTEPGRHWTMNRMNPRGAARIEFGQYSAWQVGRHRDHEALVQTGGEVTVRRDSDNNMIRTGDPDHSGHFGINIHHGWNQGMQSIGRTSAGCTVIPQVAQFQRFLTLVKGDVRYRRNNRFVFSVAFLPGNQVV